MAFQTFPIRRQMEEAMSQTTWQKLVGGGDPAVNVIKFQPTKLKSQEKSLADLNSSTICPPLPFSVYKFQYFPQSHPRTISALLFFSFPSLSFILPLLCCMTRLYVTLCLPFSFTTFPFHFLSMAPFLVRCLSHGIFTGASPWVKTKAKPLNFCWMKGAKCRHAPTPTTNSSTLKTKTSNRHGEIWSRCRLVWSIIFLRWHSFNDCQIDCPRKNIA